MTKGLIINKPGMFTTIQDLGRKGFRTYGIPWCGPADELAMRLANILLGNPEGAPVLEITMLGPEVEFTSDTVFSITGADLSPKLNGQNIPLWTAIHAKRGSCLRFGRCICGYRAYLAFYGGIVSAVVMGSSSTDVRAGIGGVGGRALRAGDQLLIGKPRMSSIPKRRLSAKFIPDYRDDLVIEVLPGIHFAEFSEADRSAFLAQAYQVAPESDRMGLRLLGPAISMPQSSAVLYSIPAIPGSVQITGDGKPIVLFVDSQTTGGYMQMVNVVSADLWKLGQVKPGETVSFSLTTLEQAVHRRREIENFFTLLRGANG